MARFRPRPAAAFVTATLLICGFGSVGPARGADPAPGAPPAHPLSATAAPAMPVMARYQFGLLRRGSTWSAERTPRTDSIQAGHMANIHRMHELGKLVAAGPFQDGGDLRGVFLFRADSIAEVRSLASADPAIASGRLRLDVWEYYAPAGIGDRYKQESRRPGHRDSMITVTFAVLKKGPRYVEAMSPELMKLQQQHVAGVLALIASGEALSAGPIAGGEDWAGLLFLKGGIERARQFTDADPLVRAGHFVAEIHPLWIADGALR